MTVLSLALWAGASAWAQSFTITDHGVVVGVGASGSYYEYNVGSPSVTYDPDNSEFVMFFEYRGAWGTPSRCASGASTEWGIGRATSPDGLTWTVDATPALEPVEDTFYECAAVQPTVVYEGPGEWHMFFKAWQENGKVCDGVDDPEWGCDLVPGVGYATSTDGITWTVPSTVPVLTTFEDPTPEDFGWPRVVQVSGTWMLFMNYGDNGITLATAQDPEGPWDWEGFTQGSGYREVVEPDVAITWMEDELIVGDVSCNDEPGTDMLQMWFGGHDRDPANFWTSPPNSRALGYATAADLDDWTVGNPEEIFWDADDITDDVAWRSWSVVPVGEEYVIFYQTKGSGLNEVGLAYTSADTKWNLADAQGDVCTWFGNAPDTVDDAYTTVEETELVVPAPGVLDNDVDHERNVFTISLQSNPSNGVLVFDDTDGSFTYEPDADFFGVDTFTYNAADASSTSIDTTVSITVTNEPDQPVAFDDAYSVTEDRGLVVDAGSGVLSNDTDADGDALTATLVSGASEGTLLLSADGSFTYTPGANFFGTDAFTYMAVDAEMSSEVRTVTLTVDPVNDAPVVSDHAYTVVEDGQLVVAGALIEMNADVEGDPLTARVVRDVANGALALETDGSFRYTPDENFAGTDGFTFVVSDGTDDSDVGEVEFTVTAVNDAPVAVADSYEVVSNTVLEVNVDDGVLENDTDIENDALEATVVSEPSNGTIVLDSNGGFTYTPAEDFVGMDMFTYEASDGTDTAPAVTVMIDVTAEETGCSTVPTSWMGAPWLLLGLLARRRQTQR